MTFNKKLLPFAIPIGALGIAIGLWYLVLLIVSTYFGNKEANDIWESLGHLVFTIQILILSWYAILTSTIIAAYILFKRAKKSQRDLATKIYRNTVRIFGLSLLITIIISFMYWDK